VWWGVVLISAGVPAVGRPWGLPVIPSPVAVAGMMGFAVSWSAGSIRGGDRARVGGHDQRDPRRPARAAVHAAAGECRARTWWSRSA